MSAAIIQPMVTGAPRWSLGWCRISVRPTGGLWPWHCRHRRARDL